MKECDDRIAEEASQVPANKATAVVPAATCGATTVATPAEDKEDGVNMENSLPNVEVPCKPKYRHDFYNSTTEGVLTIFAKGVPADTVVVDFREQMLSVSIEVPGEEPYHFQPRLFAKIIPEKCKYVVLSTMVEIRLAKTELLTWTSLHYSGKRRSLRR